MDEKKTKQEKLAKDNHLYQVLRLVNNVDSSCSV